MVAIAGLVLGLAAVASSAISGHKQAKVQRQMMQEQAKANKEASDRAAAMMRKQENAERAANRQVAQVEPGTSSTQPYKSPTLLSQGPAAGGGSTLLGG